MDVSPRFFEILASETRFRDASPKSLPKEYY